MEENICLLCLKSFSSSPLTEHFVVPNLTKFLKFVTNFLHISTSATTQLLRADGGEKEVFCEKCEIAVINPICQLYYLLLSTQLRLSWELGQLSKMLENSKTSVSSNMAEYTKSLATQLGASCDSDVAEFRQLLMRTCRFEGRKYQPLTVIFREEKLPDQPPNDDDVDKGEQESDLFEPEVDCKPGYDDDDNWSPSSFDALQQNEDQNFEEGSNAPALFEEPIKEEVIDNDSINKISHITVEIEPESDFKSELNGIQKASVRKKDAKNEGKKLQPQQKTRKFICVDCKLEFKTLNQIHAHRRRCHKQMTCEFCKKLFRSQITLKNHIDTTHQKEKSELQREQFPCPTCGKFYASLKSLNRHLEVMHSDIRHKCLVCSKLFRCKFKMKQHHAAVHDPKTHICANCGKTFTTRKYLCMHMARSHPETGPEAKLLCAYCPERFRVKYSLEIHVLKTHPDAPENLTCSTCGLKMENRRKSHMAAHLLTHKSLEERRLEGSLDMCHVCGKEFLSKDCYTKHLATHQRNDDQGKT